MRKLIIACICCACASLAQAQQTAAVKFGYLSCDSVMHQMADYKKCQTDMQELKGKYEQEATRVEEDFNKKYEDFLEGQADMPKNILIKRQTELKEMMQKNIEFKKESQRLLRKAEKESMDKVRDKLNHAIALTAKAKGLAFVINTDGQACPYTDPEQCTDITEDVKRILSE